MWWVPLALSADPELACCTSPAVAENLDRYLKMQVALATEGDRSWDGHIYGWEPQARRAASSLPPGDREVLLEIADALKALKGRPDRDKVIAAFPEISRRMTWLVVRHAGGGRAVVEGVCDGRGWLQAPGPVASPYGCGSLRAW